MRAVPCTDGDALYRDVARPGDVFRIHRLLASHPEDCVTMSMASIYRRLERFRVVRDGTGAAVACAGLLPIDGRRSEIRGVVVHPDARGRGLGVDVVRDVVRLGLEEDREIVCVSRHPAFFERLGFARIGLHEVPKKDAVTRGHKPRCALVYRGDAPPRGTLPEVRT